MQLASRSHIIQLDNVSERKIMIMEKNPVLCLELAFFQYLFKIIPNWLVLCARCELDAHYRNGSLAYLNEGGSCLIRLFFPFLLTLFLPSSALTNNGYFSSDKEEKDQNKKRLNKLTNKIYLPCVMVYYEMEKNH